MCEGITKNKVSMHSHLNVPETSTYDSVLVMMPTSYLVAIVPAMDSKVVTMMMIVVVGSSWWKRNADGVERRPSGRMPGSHEIATTWNSWEPAPFSIYVCKCVECNICDCRFYIEWGICTHIVAAAIVMNKAMHGVSREFRQKKKRGRGKKNGNCLKYDSN